MAIWYGALLFQQQLDGVLSRQLQSSELLKMHIEADLDRFSTQLLGVEIPLQKLVSQPNHSLLQPQIETLLHLLVASEPSSSQAIVVSLEGGLFGGTGSEQANRHFAREIQALFGLGGVDADSHSDATQIPISPLVFPSATSAEQGKGFVVSLGIGSPVVAVLATRHDAGSLWLGKESLLGQVDGHDGRYFLLDAKARLMAGLSGEDYKVGDVVEHLARPALLADKQWPLQQTYLNGEGVQVYASRREIPALAWTLISEVTQASIVQPVWQLLLMLSLFASAAVLIIIVFILRLMQRFLLPIAAARAAIDQVSEGDYQLSLAPVGIPEIDEMTVSIQRMSAARQVAEYALQESRQDLLVTLNSIGDGVIACDKKGLITRMNRVAEELTGWSIETARGQPVDAVFNIVDASTLEPIASPVEQVLDRGETVHSSHHTTLIAKGGRHYQITDSTAPICDDGEYILGMVLVFNDVTESYQLREKANAAQRQMQALLEDMHTMVAITEPNGRVIFANKTPLVASGIGLEDVQGKKLWDCVWFEESASLQAQIQKFSREAGAGAFVQQDIQISVMGGLLWVEYSMHPMVDEGGEVVQILHEGRDISTRKTMEDEARAAAQHLRLYREQTPLAAIEWSTDIQVVDWNAAAEDMFGYSLEEIKGQNLTGLLISESEWLQAKSIFAGLKLDSGAMTGRTRTHTRDGRVLLCEWHNTLLRDEQGSVIGAASVVLDITAQQEAKEALLLKEREQRDILDCMVDAVITIDEYGTVVSMNKTTETLFGYTSEELIGKNVALLMPATDAAQPFASLQRYLQTEEAHIIGEGRDIVGQHKNASTFPLRLQAAELPVAANGMRRFIGTCHDLTKSKQQEEQLRRSYKMDALGKLTSGVAHDFNNILGVVMGYADLMAGMVEEESKLARYVHEINHAGLRGARLTKKLLSLSRHEILSVSRLDINKLLLEQQDMLQKTLTVSIKLIFDLAPEIWPIYLDRSDLEDAVLNMSINAMHAMADNTEGARLMIHSANLTIDTLSATTLGLSKAGDYVELRIADTGSGMDEGTREQIFDPFFSTKGEQGTGLGLSQVFGFVSRAGGAIKVYSEPGHGTDFVLYFPRYLDEPAKAESEIIEPVELPGGREQILVVDDEEALRELVAELLSQKGYRVLCAKNAEQALQIMESTSIDLILSDLIMPGMNGYQLAAMVRKKYPATKILLASGFVEQRNSEKIDQQLYAQMLHKPYNSRVLYRTVRDLLDTESTPLT